MFDVPAVDGFLYDLRIRAPVPREPVHVRSQQGFPGAVRDFIARRLDKIPRIQLHDPAEQIGFGHQPAPVMLRIASDEAVLPVVGQKGRVIVQGARGGLLDHMQDPPALEDLLFRLEDDLFLFMPDLQDVLIGEDQVSVRFPAALQREFVLAVNAVRAGDHELRAVKGELFHVPEGDHGAAYVRRVFPVVKAFHWTGRSAPA